MNLEAFGWNCVVVDMPSTAGVKCDVDACASVLTAFCLAILQVV